MRPGNFLEETWDRKVKNMLMDAGVVATAGVISYPAEVVWKRMVLLDRKGGLKAAVQSTNFKNGLYVGFTAACLRNLLSLQALKIVKKR